MGDWIATTQDMRSVVHVPSIQSAEKSSGGFVILHLGAGAYVQTDIPYERFLDFMKMLGMNIYYVSRIPGEQKAGNDAPR